MWIHDAERIAVVEVAKRLNLKIMKSNSIGPCPNCATVERGSKDKRGAIGIVTGVARKDRELTSFHFVWEALNFQSSPQMGKIRYVFGSRAKSVTAQI